LRTHRNYLRKGQCNKASSGSKELKKLGSIIERASEKYSHEKKIENQWRICKKISPEYLSNSIGVNRRCPKQTVRHKMVRNEINHRRKAGPDPPK